MITSAWEGEDKKYKKEGRKHMLKGGKNRERQKDRVRYLFIVS